MYKPFVSEHLLSRIGCWSLVAGLLVVGCSKNERDAGTVAVSGKVTYNAQPVEGAIVTFVSDGAAAPGGGMTTADGTYTLKVKPGNYTATVTKTETPVNTENVSMEQAAANEGKPQTAPKDLLPTKYKSAMESPLKFEVKQTGENKFDLTLSDG